MVTIACFFGIKERVITAELCIFTKQVKFLISYSMKIASRILSLMILVMVTTFYVGCKKDDDDKKTEEEIQLDKLKGVWTVVSANDGDDRTADFDDPAMVLTLEGNYAEGGTYNYSLTGERPDPSPWPASGTWKFGTNKSTQIVRDPGGVNEIAMTYSVTDTDLIIEFNVPDGSAGWPGGRIGSVTGDWTFTFTK